MKNPKVHAPKPQVNKSRLIWWVNLSEQRWVNFVEQQSDGMALNVHYAFGAAAKARIGTGDIVVAANGRTDFKTESELVAYLRLTKPAMTSVRLKLFRKGAFREADLPLDLER